MNNAHVEYFEELSAAASVGEASGAELAELKEHMAECPSCRDAYSEFLHLSAVRTANAVFDAPVGAEEAIGYVDSAVFRQKFLRRAEAEGVVFSRTQESTEFVPPSRRLGKPRRWSLVFALPIAAACLLAAGLAGGYYWKSREIGRATRNGATTSAATHTSIPNGGAASNELGEIARLQAENQKLSSQVASLKTSLAEQTKTANGVQETAAASEKERGSLAAELKVRQARISELEARISQSQVELASMKSHVESVEANENALASERMRVRELSDQLA